jgi:hypothetical protein
MESTYAFTRNQMLQAIRQIYENQETRFEIGKMVGLDGCALKPWVIGRKTHPFKWFKIGVVCFEEGRQKKQVFKALTIGDKTYNFPEYALWCVSNTLKDAKTVFLTLPSPLQKKTVVNDLSEHFSSKPTKPLIFAPETISQDTDSTLYWNIKEYVELYGYTIVQVYDTVKPRIHRVFQLLAFEEYPIEEMMTIETRTLYRIYKPPEYDLDLSQISHLSQTEWRKLESKMLKNHFIVVRYRGYTAQDERMLTKWITSMFQKLAEEPLPVTEKSAQGLVEGESRPLWWQIQRMITDEYLAKRVRIDYSFERGDPDIVVFDDSGKVVEVVAVKSYSIDVRTKKGQRNAKGMKCTVSFTANKDAKAEVRTAIKNNLNEIRLICVNLKTRHRIFDGLIPLTIPVTLKEESEEYKKQIAREKGQT